MKTRNKLLTLLILSAGAATTTALINKAVKLSAVSKHILESRVSLCYRWRLGNIHYTKIGEGKLSFLYTTFHLHPAVMNGIPSAENLQRTILYTPLTC